MHASIVILYCPFPTLDAARVAARALLGAKLVACCNLLPKGESHYIWEGEMTIAAETILLAKTMPHLEAAAMQQLAAIHPYETPAILSFPATSSDAFAAWVMAALGSSTTADIG